MASGNASKYFSHFRAEFQSKKIVPALFTGILMGVTELIFAISMGSLIFSGEMAAYLPYGIGIALVTETIMLIVISLGTSIPGITGTLQDSSSVILAVIVTTLVGTLSASSLEDKFITAIVAIALITLLTGIFFLLIGHFRAGDLARFLPYPVVGGFLAGMGWLLVRGSFSVMTDITLSIANLPELFQPNQLILWMPGVLLAILLFLSLRRSSHFLVPPAILLAMLGLFYLGLLVTGTSIESAIAQGILLGEQSGNVAWQPLSWDYLSATDWGALFGQSGNIVSILILSLINLLLTASALELAYRDDIDLNHELKVAGMANILTGLGGGMIGFHTIDLSVLNKRIGLSGRLPVLVAGIFCGLMLFVGAQLLAFFPRPILGGILFFLGLGFLVEWVIDSWKKLPRADYAIVILILIVIGTTDFLVGVGVGLVATVILFILNYSQINVVRHVLSGAEMKSNVGRSHQHRQVLTKRGQGNYILELQGFIFFGTANALVKQIRIRVTDSKLPPVHYIILDFRRVNGVDISAVFSFLKILHLIESSEITLVLTHLSERVQQQFKRSGFFEESNAIQIFSDLDHGLEWCENNILTAENIAEPWQPCTLFDQLAVNGLDQEHCEQLVEYLERVEVGEGECIILQGAAADALYFIEQGRASVYMELDGGEKLRLETLELGMVVGEVGLYLGTPRTSSVIADIPTTVFRLSRESLYEMKQKAPKLLAAFHEFIVRFLAERLIEADQLINSVLR
jgi:sulfate permease, SulP family